MRTISFSSSTPSDLCPRESVHAWVHALQQESSVVPFRCSTACMGLQGTSASLAKSYDDAVGVHDFFSVLNMLAKDVPIGEPVRVALVGLVNVSCRDTRTQHPTLTLP